MIKTRAKTNVLDATLKSLEAMPTRLFLCVLVLIFFAGCNAMLQMGERDCGRWERYGAEELPVCPLVCAPGYDLVIPEGFEQVSGRYFEADCSSSSSSSSHLRFQGSAPQAQVIEFYHDYLADQGWDVHCSAMPDHMFIAASKDAKACTITVGAPFHRSLKDTTEVNIYLDPA